MFSDVIIYILLAGVYVWLFIMHHKLDEEETSKPPINLNVNVSTKGGPAQDKQTTRQPTNTKQKKTAKSGEIPIQTPDRSKSWKDVEVEDSFSGQIKN